MYMIGEIRLFAFGFVPRGWAACNGQLLPVSTNQALFSIVGTTYGGNGTTTFALPDLRGRTPRHVGSSGYLGRSGGAESHYLVAPELPVHGHGVQVSSGVAVSDSPVGSLPAAGPDEAFGEGTIVNMGGSSDIVGAGQPHENRQPFLAMNACMALEGILPSRDWAEMDHPDPFLGEVRMFAGNFAPRGWAFCDGSLLSITQNTALFSLLGTSFGGSGTVDFGLPDLRGRVPVGTGTGPGSSPYVMGQAGGAERVSLTTNQIPPHLHAVVATDARSTSNAPRGRPARTRSAVYARDSGAAPVQSTSAGGGQPHENMAPSLGLSFIIATEGIYPPRD